MDDGRANAKRVSERRASLPVHVQPRASRTEIAGWQGDALKIRLAAPPVDGAANDVLIRFLSRALGVSRSQVSLAAGPRSRRKRVVISGIDDMEVRRRLGVDTP